MSCCPIPSTTEKMGYADGDVVPQSTGKLKGVPKKTKLDKNGFWILNMKDFSQEAVLFTVWCTHEYIKL